jgi:hypothetical protein
MDVVADGHFALFMTYQNLRYYSTPIYLCSGDVCLLSFFADLVYPLQLVSCLPGSEMLDY